MVARPLSLLALLGACTSPENVDSGADAFTPLPGRGARVEIGLDGLWLDDGQDGLGLSTESWGREGALKPQPLAAPRDGGCWPGSPRLRPATCQPTLERPLQGGLERWTRANGGVQQGWTLDEAPSGDGPLVLEVAVSGATPTLSGELVLLETPAGGRWTYAGLQAWDDRKRTLDAWMTVEGDLIRIHVDDTDATWPIHIDPVLSTASTTLTESSTDFGIGVSLGGDVNNDGYADALVGARFGTALYGQAFSYHGSSSGLNTTESRSWTGADYYGKFGEYVDNGGDINGDGYDDAIVCEFYSERFFVYHGSSSGLGSSSSATVTGVYGLGRGLEIVGDFNNDGYDDVAAASQEPQIDFYRGSSSGLNTTSVYSDGTSAAPSVSRAGDVNNDGYDDVVYGDATANTIYLIRGASSFPGTTTTLTRSGSSELGFDVAGGGDINGDGYDDIVTGDPTYSSSTGRLVVYYGSSSGVSTSNYATLSAPSSGTGFGYTVQMVGDVNGDGYDDVAVSDDYDHSYTYVFHGSSSGLRSTPANTLNIGDANFGYSIGGKPGGDVTNDGFDDVLIGTIGSTAYLYEGCQDADGDGECEDVDCDDTDAAVYSEATEVCDDVDNDCDGLTDDSDTSVASAGKSTFYRDADGDGYGVSTTTVSRCDAPSGYVSNSTDCNDSSSSINPGATETAGDGVDSTCDGRETCYVDADNDNYRTTSTVSSTDSDCSDSGEALSSDTSGDCDDTSASVYPGATETTGDGIDSSCDGLETCYADADNDNYRTTTTVSSTDSDCSDSGEALSSDTSGDCNDSSSSINPGATETAGDGTDSNCDGLETCYADADNDLYRTSTTVSSTDSDCSDSGEALSSETSGDCNDASASINPGATETAGDGTDSNCDGLETCYADADNDLYRTSTTVSSTDSDCSDSGEALSSETSGDCDDTSSSINPAATEVCDGDDNDCDGLTDSADSSVDTSSGGTYYDDDDGDGYGDPADRTSSCDAPTGYVSNDDDCNDTSAAISPADTEITGDGVDSNCDGSETCYADADNDLYRTTTTVSSTDSDCNDSGEALSSDTSGDCNDSSSSINPGATETTGDGTDGNCDGLETCYADVDNDSYRTSSTVSSTDSDCSDPGEALSSESSGDCDDADSAINPAASEVCDGDDNDCDGLTDSADSSVDADSESTYYGDDDGDGYGDPGTTTTSCDLPSGYAASDDDCDDSDGDIHPGAIEAAGDGVDSDCDDAELCYADGDDDGYRTTSTTASSDTDCSDAGEALGSDTSGDCDDADDSIYPGAPDPDYDGIDQDCSGYTNDVDNDGHDAIAAGGDDCDDADDTVYAGAPDAWYDGVDSDCAGDSDYDADVDGQDSDLYGGADCDDADNSVYTGASDAWYDGVDSDCAGDSDYDADLDGQDSDLYGGADCDDADDSIYAGASDAWYDGVDGDCAGNSDYDADLDGQDSDLYGGADCDDADVTVYPGAPELEDGLDNDCDGYDELYDGDQDGLTDLDETELGTDPDDADTDDDTVTDGDEVLEAGTDPLDPDSDSGGLDDGSEIGRGSDPNDASDDNFPLSYVKGGCACTTAEPAPTGLAWLLALAPLTLLRRKSRQVAP